jgi:nucleoside-diphosphate-sugar epimerase
MGFTVLKGKRVLVTGGSGFIASHLCRRLLAEEAILYVTTKYNSMVDNIRLAAQWGDIRVIEADLRNTDSLAQLRSIKPEIVFHMAAYNHVGDSFLHVSEAIDSNAKGTANLMEAWQDYERFVYISTSEVYGYQESVPFTETMFPQPMSPYAVGKYAGEIYARMKFRSAGKPVAVLRPFNAFGPYQSPRAIIPELILKCLRGEQVTTTEGKQTREFNFVENLVDGVIKAATVPEAVGEVINLGSGREIAIRDLVKEIHRCTDSTSELRIGALPYRAGEIWRMCADNAKAARLLDWTPTLSFEEGIKRTVAWFRDFVEAMYGPHSQVVRLGR